jgi:hypothetical protein
LIAETAFRSATGRDAARKAALRQRDRAVHQTCLGGQDAVVDLIAEPWRARLDAQALQVLLAQGGKALRRILVEHLHRRNPVVVVRDSGAILPEEQVRAVLFELDLRLGGEPHAKKLVAQGLAELRLRQQQEIVLSAPQHAHRRDHARLRRQQQRLARLPGRE